MSESRMKATRRDLRRAFGPEVIDLIRALTSQQAALLRVVQAQEQRIAALEAGRFDPSASGARP